MSNRDYGYLDNPANGLDIVRARTLIGNLRLWDIPRKEQALEIAADEIGESAIPGLYILFDERSEKRVYIGQTENLKSRISSHMKSPEDKIKNWDRAIIINDGRNAHQSDLNDENIRLVLEDYLVNLFKVNKYKVTTVSSRTPSLSSTLKTLTITFKEELVVLLTRKSKISKILMERGDDEVHNDDVKKIILKNNYRIQSWSKIEATIDDKKWFIRPGSLKSNGWQVTFRGGKPDSFKSHLERGDGFLLMPRGPVLVIPLNEIKNFILSIDPKAFLRDTIDVFVRFDQNTMTLAYKGNELHVSKYAIEPYPK